MFNDYESRGNEEIYSPKATIKAAKALKITSAVSFILAVYQTIYSLPFLKFWSNNFSFVFYCISSLLLAIALIVLTLCKESEIKRLFILSIIVIALCCVHIAAVFWISDTLRGCDSMFLMLAVPFGFIVGFIGLIFLLESVFCGFHIKRVHTKNK